MGLLDGRRALIFGVANDHSIAWGIAKAFHAEGATVGFSSMENLVERRVRPLADSIGATFVEGCDIGSDEQIRAVFDKWHAAYGEVDILVHAIAHAKREDLDGKFVDTSRDGFALALDVSAYSLVAITREARPYMHRGLVRPDPQLLRRREGRHQLQRHGRREGRARGGGALPRGGPRARRASGSTRSPRGRSGPCPRAASRASASSTGRSTRSRRSARHMTIEDVGNSAVYLASDLSSAVTGEILYVDGGFNVLGVPTLD